MKKEHLDKDLTKMKELKECYYSKVGLNGEYLHEHYLKINKPKSYEL